MKGRKFLFVKLFRTKTLAWAFNEPMLFTRMEFFSRNLEMHKIWNDDVKEINALWDQTIINYFKISFGKNSYLICNILFISVIIYWYTS